MMLMEWMSSLDPEWITKSVLRIVNEHGVIPCGSCGRIIYIVRGDKKFCPGDILAARDFMGANGYPNPIDGTRMVCPECGQAMIKESLYGRKEFKN